MTWPANMPEADWVSPDGTIRLHLGDCLSLLPKIPAGCVDCCLTDPPYEIVMTGGGIGDRRQYTHDTNGFTDCGFDYSILSAFPNWVCFGALKQVPKLIECAKGKRWMLVTWNKPNPTPLCNGNYLPDTEYIVHAWQRGCLHGEYTDKSRFIVHPVNDVEDGTHPNEKPLRVILKMVRLAVNRGSAILDPYMGSGTTAVACIKTGRRCIGVELDEKYFRIAVERCEKAVADGGLYNGFVEPAKVKGLWEEQ